jgi:hypothetical protein
MQNSRDYGTQDLVAFVKKGKAEMTGTCGKGGRQQSPEANAVQQTRRKTEERETPIEVVRRSGGGRERNRSEEMED